MYAPEGGSTISVTLMLIKYYAVKDLIPDMLLRTTIVELNLADELNHPFKKYSMIQCPHSGFLTKS